MASVNKVIIVGNLGADPEVKTFENGGKIANISVATTEKWTDRNTGEPKEHTEWHRITFNDRLADIVAQYLRKGSSVYVEGQLRTRKWQDPQTGQDRYTTEIRANSMQMLGGSNRNNDNNYNNNHNNAGNHNSNFNNNGGFNNNSHFNSQPNAGVGGFNQSPQTKQPYPQNNQNQFAEPSQFNQNAGFNNPMPQPNVAPMGGQGIPTPQHTNMNANSFGSPAQNQNPARNQPAPTSTQPIDDDMPF